MRTSTFVQNVAANNDSVDALPMPVYNFSRRDGQDVGGDGHNANGSTQGDTSGSTEMQPMICQECGYKFIPQAVKPLLLPEMPIANRKKSQRQTEESAGEADDGDFADIDNTPTLNCPRCGVSLV